MNQRKWYDMIRKYSEENLPDTLEQEMFDQYSKEPEFKEYSKAIDEVLEQHPNVMEAVAFHRPCNLNPEDIEPLRKYLAIRAKEQDFIRGWFLGEILRLRCKLMLKE